MIYRVSKIIATEVADRGCPLPVVYGPERLQSVAYADSRIVIERPRSATADTVFATRTTKHNPRRRAERSIAAVARVVARSTVDGARVQDHEELADNTADAIIVALQRAAAQLDTTIRIEESGLLSEDDLDATGLEAWSGVVYEIQFTVQRGVYDRTWVGADHTEIEGFEITTSGACTSTAAPDP